MNLYDLHDDPESLDHHSLVDERVPKLFWPRLMAKTKNVTKAKQKEIFKPYEKFIINSPWYAYTYARVILMGRWIEAEDTIAQDGFSSYRYATEVLTGRFKKGEAAIGKIRQCIDYARNIMQGRFPEGEDYIASKPDLIHTYVHYVTKKPFPKGEPIIAEHAYDSFIYSTEILKSRFPAGEKAIFADKYYSKMYKEHWKIEE